MSLMLDDMRKEFATFLASDPQGRWRMDRALAHVVQLAYERGLRDGDAADELERMADFSDYGQKLRDRAAELRAGK